MKQCDCVTEIYESFFDAFVEQGEPFSPLSTTNPSKVICAARISRPRAVPPPKSHNSSRNVTPNASPTRPLYFQVASRLHRQRAARAAHAEVFKECRALLKDQRYGDQENYMVDYDRLAEQALQCGQRRFGARALHILLPN